MMRNECCNKIIEISDAKLSVYEGNYDAYVVQKDMAFKRELFEYENYEKKKKRLLSVYQDKLMKGQKAEKNMQKSVQAARKKADH